jgi:3-hydroxyanthranilate 3,4-dioxygenase
MERTRPKDSIDRLQWYCPNERAHEKEPVIIRHEQFCCADIEIQLKAVIDDWMENEASRRCNECGEIAPPY